MEKQKISSIFSPQSIAIVGASEKVGKVGTAITENVLKLGYQGKVFLVNPSYESLYGQKCYKSLIEIETAVELAIIVVPAKLVVDVIRENADKIKNFVIISAGFSETGKEGLDREKEIKIIAQAKNLNILGPNCLGFINPHRNLNASFAMGMPEKGNIALVSQSGALMVAALDIAKKDKIGFSSLVSIGNKVRLGENEMLIDLAEDENTKVIGMYLEGIKSGNDFIKIASIVSKKKPIVILKAGKTEKSQKAISSHTGALSGSDKIMEAVFEKCGIIRAESLEDFFEILKTFSMTDAPENKKVAIVTNAGGAGVLATDSFDGKEIMLADFSEEFKQKLRNKLPAEGSVENPVDILGDAAEDRYQYALENLINGDAGSILCILTPQDKTPVEKIAQVIINIKQQTNKIVVASFIGGESIKTATEKMRKSGVLTFDFPEKAIKILNYYYIWAKKSKLDFNGQEENLSLERKETVQMIINNSKQQGKKALRFDEAAKIMELYGLNCINSYYLKKDKLFFKKIIYPVVAKIDSDQILHKTDQQALILNIKNDEELKLALDNLWKKFPNEEILVQPMIEKGTELIIGISRDSIFGPIVVAGLGGIYTEIFKMVDFFIPPMECSEIVDKLSSGKLKFLFTGARGQKKFDIDEVAGIIKSVMFFAQEIDTVKEFDINPLFIYNTGKKSVAVDLKIIF